MPRRRWPAFWLMAGIPMLVLVALWVTSYVWVPVCQVGWGHRSLKCVVVSGCMKVATRYDEQSEKGIFEWTFWIWWQDQVRNYDEAVTTVNSVGMHMTPIIEPDGDFEWMNEEESDGSVFGVSVPIYVPVALLGVVILAHVARRMRRMQAKPARPGG